MRNDIVSLWHALSLSTLFIMLMRPIDCNCINLLNTTSSPEKMISRRQKKKYVVYGLITLILLVIAFFSIKSYLFPSFSGGFSKIQRIEAQYNGDFRYEKINVTSIKREDFNRFIEDLEEFNDDLLNKRNTTDVQALDKFAQIRMSMLKSEKFFRLGDDIGNVGKVKDIDGFRCSEMNYILNAAYYFNRSWTYGVDTQLELDDLLVQYKKVPKL